MNDITPAKIVLEPAEPVQYFRQDGGYTLAARIVNMDSPVFQVLLQSCEEQDRRLKPVHQTARMFAGKKIRVTVEVVE